MNVLVDLLFGWIGGWVTVRTVDPVYGFDGYYRIRSSAFDEAKVDGRLIRDFDGFVARDVEEVGGGVRITGFDVRVFESREKLDELIDELLDEFDGDAQ